MSSRLDDRIRSLVVELLDDPPVAPPFPHPDMVVIKDGRSTRRERMTDIRVRPDTGTMRRRRGPLLGAAVFAAIIVIAMIGAVVTNLLDGDEGPVGGPGGRLSGTTWEFRSVADSQAGILRFTAGDRFTTTRPDGVAVDAGTYRIVGDTITFISEAPHACAGFEGTYRWVFSEPGRSRWQVVFDDCVDRIADAVAVEIVQVLD